MNKTTIISIVVVVVVAGLATYGWMNRSEAPADNDMVEGSLRDLLAFQGSQECTFNQDSDEAESNGKAYISAGRLRTDFTSEINDTNIDGHVIVKNDMVYVWMDGQPQGFTMNIAATESATGASAETFDLDQEVSYSCDSWTTDEAKFAQPTNVQFMDVTAMVAGSAAASSTAPSATTSSSQCNACASLSEPQRSQCRTALRCQ